MSTPATVGGLVGGYAAGQSVGHIVAVVAAAPVEIAPDIVNVTSYVLAVAASAVSYWLATRGVTVSAPASQPPTP